MRAGTIRYLASRKYAPPANTILMAIEGLLLGAIRYSLPQWGPRVATKTLQEIQSIITGIIRSTVRFPINRGETQLLCGIPSITEMVITESVKAQVKSLATTVAPSVKNDALIAKEIADTSGCAKTMMQRGCGGRVSRPLSHRPNAKRKPAGTIRAALTEAFLPCENWIYDEKRELKGGGSHSHLVEFKTKTIESQSELAEQIQEVKPSFIIATDGAHEDPRKNPHEMKPFIHRGSGGSGWVIIEVEEDDCGEIRGKRFVGNNEEQWGDTGRTLASHYPETSAIQLACDAMAAELRRETEENPQEDELGNARPVTPVRRMLLISDSLSNIMKMETLKPTTKDEATALDALNGISREFGIRIIVQHVRAHGSIRLNNMADITAALGVNRENSLRMKITCKQAGKNMKRYLHERVKGDLGKYVLRPTGMIDSRFFRKRMSDERGGKILSAMICAKAHYEMCGKSRDFDRYTCRFCDQSILEKDVLEHTFMKCPGIDELYIPATTANLDQAIWEKIDEAQNFIGRAVRRQDDIERDLRGSRPTLENDNHWESGAGVGR